MIPIIQADRILLIIGMNFWVCMDNERCSQAICILATVMRMIPISTSLIARHSFDLVSECLIRWYTTLGYSDSTIKPRSRIEEHSVMMDCSVVV